MPPGGREHGGLVGGGRYAGQNFAGGGVEGHEVAAPLAQQALGVGLQLGVDAQAQVLPLLEGSIGGPAAVHFAVAVGEGVIGTPVASQQTIIIAFDPAVAQAVVAAPRQPLGQVQKRLGGRRLVAQHGRSHSGKVAALAPVLHHQAGPRGGVAAQAVGLGPGDSQHDGPALHAGRGGLGLGGVGGDDAAGVGDRLGAVGRRASRQAGGEHPRLQGPGGPTHELVERDGVERRAFGNADSVKILTGHQ